MKRKLSESIVQALPPAKESSSYITWDYDVPGFGVRTTERGTKSFILNYSFKGTERRMVLARYFPEQNTVALARAKAAELKNLIIAGKDPIAVEIAAEEARDKEGRTQYTFAELAQRFQNEYVQTSERKQGQPKRPASKLTDKSMLDGILLPRFGGRKLADVVTRDINTLIVELKATPYRANRCRALLHTMFEFALGNEMLLVNPVTKFANGKGVMKYRERKRNFFLTDAQLAAFIRACDDYHDQDAADIFRLLLHTGSRKSEVLKARWEQFHLEPGPLQGMWVKPFAAVKGDEDVNLELSDRCLAILQKMKPKKTGYLFPAKGRFDKPRGDIQRPWAQICKLAGLTTAITKPGIRRLAVTRHIPILRLHDLRHSYASYLVSHGASLEQIGKQLGHAEESTATARYAHLSRQSQKAVANLFLADVPPAKKPPVIVSQQPRKRRKL
jgi:integrase